MHKHSIDDLFPEFDQYECRIETLWRNMTRFEGIIDNEQNRTQVHTAINKLPDKYRNVLLLRDIEGYDTSQVAEILEISESNVKVRLHRSHAALKKLIEPLLRGKIN